MDARPVQLRASLVWRDEVMEDVVFDEPRPLTVGSSKTCTFLVPDLGLPGDFAIIKPGNRGYLLTLGHRMRGTVAVDGETRDVADFVRRGAEGEPGGDASSFRATPIGGRDWGVIDLDPSGDYKLFFQFVPVEAPLPRETPQLMKRIELIVGGVAAAIVAMIIPAYAMLVFGAGMLAFAIIEIVLGFLRAEDDDYTRPAIAFALLMFAILMGVFYTMKSDEKSPWLPPSPRELIATYMVDRILIEEPEPEPEPTPVLADQTSEQKQAAAEAAEKREKIVKSPAATKGEEGASGGEGDERATDPDARDLPPPPDVGLTTGENRAQLDRVKDMDKTLDNMVAAIQGMERRPGDMGSGPGRGTGVGPGEGTGTRDGSRGKGRKGGGSAEGDFRSGKDVDVAAREAPSGTGGKGSGVKEAKVAFTGASGEFTGGLSREEVDRVIKSRKGTIQKCYQREVDRDPSIAGKIVVSFRISADGKVQSARIDGGKSTLSHAGVRSCVKRQIETLEFPAKGGAVVNYPFIFSRG